MVLVCLPKFLVLALCIFGGLGCVLMIELDPALENTVDLLILLVYFGFKFCWEFWLLFVRFLLLTRVLGFVFLTLGTLLFFVRPVFIFDLTGLRLLNRFEGS